MAGFEHEYDRDKSEQGMRVAIDSALENSGYKEERLGEVRRQRRRAASARPLTTTWKGRDR